jgi:hypothetical protein
MNEEERVFLDFREILEVWLIAGLGSIRRSYRLGDKP